MPTLTVTAGGHYAPSRNFFYTDGLTWATGWHMARFRAQTRTFSDYNGRVPTDTDGNSSFDARFTSFAYADFLPGLQVTRTRIAPIVGRTQKAYKMQFYATDTFEALGPFELSETCISSLQGGQPIFKVSDLFPGTGTQVPSQFFANK